MIDLFIDPAPATAQAAEQEGKYIAQQLNRKVNIAHGRHSKITLG